MAAKIKYLFVMATVLLVVINQGCRKESVTVSGLIPNLPEKPYHYTFSETPFQFSDPFQNQPVDNPVTDAGAALGRVLFYDGRLSLNNTVSCATCHKQQNAFADRAASSTGFEGRITRRNSMAIINTGMSSAYFWDIRALTLEEQVLMPVKNHVEMGLEEMSHLEQKLAAVDFYPPLFEAAFGTPDVTSDRISKALAQFLRSMVSYRSKYDEGLKVNFTNFNPLENMGRELFFSWDMPCQSCHSGDNFAGWGTEVANIGLDENYADNGLGEIEQWQQFGNFYNGVFKVPSLRNVAVTGPYMHDGRFNSLDEVIEHYNSEVKSHPNLDYRLTTNGGIFFEGDGGFDVPVDNGNGNGTFVPEPRKLNLTEVQKRALVAFLETLTDHELMQDPKFSDPFK